MVLGLRFASIHRRSRASSPDRSRQEAGSTEPFPEGSGNSPRSRPDRITVGSRPGESDYRPSDVATGSETATRQLLVLAVRYHSGWTVTVDGRTQCVHRVYVDFLGCRVEPGRHKVRFRFQPQSLAVGRVVSLAALGLVIAWPPLTRLRHRAGRSIAESSGFLCGTDRSLVGSRNLPVPHFSSWRRRVIRHSSGESRP